jgi:cytochrome c peroxidase
MWDGRGTDLAATVREMLTDAVFMNGDLRIMAERIRQTPPLLALWRAAFGAMSEPRGEAVPRAIAEYLRSLDFPASAVDRYLAGDTAALPRAAAEGLRLFAGKAGCVHCHHGPLLTDGRVHRLGVPEHPALAREPLRTVSLLRHHAERGLPRHMDERGDVGAYAISKHREERGAFLTPGLRGLAQTGPYMHNGRYASLEEVLDFHDRGGGAGSALRPLGLSAAERRALVAFLLALSPPLPAAAEPPVHDYGSHAGARP